jgi:hypothetical protein
MVRRARASSVVIATLAVACSAQFRFGDIDDASADDVGDSPSDHETSSSGCKTDADCGLSSLHCDTVSGLCFPCTIDAHCTTTGFPRCDVAIHRCVGCGSGSDCPSGACEPITKTCVQKCPGAACPADAPSCDTTKGFCVQCKKSAECTVAGVKHVCDTSNGRCVECEIDGQCTLPQRPRCDLATGACVRCELSSDCPPGKLCDPTKGDCV